VSKVEGLEVLVFFEGEVQGGGFRLFLELERLLLLVFI
jgi:hypothetical protein